MPLPDASATSTPPSAARRDRVRPARAPLPAINSACCTGCGRCIAVCSVHVLTFEIERWTKFAVLVDADPCTGYSLCENRYPFNVITMRPGTQVQAHGTCRVAPPRP